ncbi:hypothetical protein J4772_00440 [Cohnella sp. LGH]|uniref:hypothetical protein n=1 Tax=Cohnella sp. LGH TaxID=1619153 RepID=UPI001ADCC88D|nr:hypothetical protein [Cohnella sp. LGH]QTH42998.1 hypothetical protein J4772_00440 [Cohnella sp. LGH]
MKINKLSFTIILILIFIVVLWFVQNQFKHESGDDNLLQDNFEQGIPRPEADNLKFVEELRKSHADKFAGAYLDDQNVLNINLVMGVAPNELNIDISKIKVHYVEYSYKELNEVFEQIVSLTENQPVQVVGIDEKENKINITLHQDNKSVEDFIKKEIDFPFIEYQITDARIQL